MQRLSSLKSLKDQAAQATKRPRGAQDVLWYQSDWVLERLAGIYVLGVVEDVPWHRAGSVADIATKVFDSSDAQIVVAADVDRERPKVVGQHYPSVRLKPEAAAASRSAIKSIKPSSEPDLRVSIQTESGLRKHSVRLGLRHLPIRHRRVQRAPAGA